jgi:hypothetical protein
VDTSYLPMELCLFIALRMHTFHTGRKRGAHFVGNQDRSVRQLFLDQWSGYKLIESVKEEKAPALKFHEVYKTCMRCCEQATTHPSDWCPEANRFNVCQSCRDAYGARWGKLKRELCLFMSFRMIHLTHAEEVRCSPVCRRYQLAL